MAAGEGLDRAGIDELGAVGESTLDLPRRQRGQLRRVHSVHLRPAPVHLAEAQEVGRVGAEAGGQAADERPLVGLGEERVRLALLTDRGGPIAAARRRAERAGAVGG